MKIRGHSQMSEAFVTGAILAVVGGYLDAYTYIARGHVFANAQTGNVMFLAMNIAGGDVLGALFYIPPMISFLLGILISEQIKKRLDGGRLHWRQYVLLLELTVIIAVSFLPHGTVMGIKHDTIANVMISFTCSLQVQSFRRISGVLCATTMCTGNLRSGSEALFTGVFAKDNESLHKAGKYFAIVLFFIIGAVIGTLVTNAFLEKSVIFCAAGLAAAVLLMFAGSSSGNDNTCMK